MQITVIQSALKRGLAVIGHAVAGKSALPVLSHVLLRTDGGRLKLSATNLEIGITHWIEAKVEHEGAITVPAKLFTDVITNLPNDTVTLSLDEKTQTLKVECGRFVSNIKGIEADEFPTIPQAAQGQSPICTIPPALLREMLAQVTFAAANDDSRPTLAGVLIRLRNDEAYVAAADGFRLAVRTAPVEMTEEREIIVPARSLEELSRIIGEDDVTMALSTGDSQVLFRADDTELVSRLIDGKFPDVAKIIPAEHTTRAIVDTAALRGAVKLASYFANTSQQVVRLTLEPAAELGPSRIVVSANTADVGDNRGEVDAMVNGAATPIALNVRFVAEVLAAITTPQVAIELQTPQSPAVFKPVGADGYLHLIMPMSLR